MYILESMPTAILQGLIWGILAIGFYISYKVLDYADLTIDGSVTLGAAVFASLVAAGQHVALAMLVATLAGMCAGLVTGLLHTRLGIPPILSGILTQLMLYSINLLIMNGANVALVGTQLLLDHNRMGLTIGIVLAFLAVVVFALYWFFGTRAGCNIRATGNNPSMSRAQGINTKLYTVLGLVISNGIVGLAGSLLAQMQGGANVTMGTGAIVTALAAVIIGSAVVKRISRNFAVKMLGVALGGVIYFIIFNLIINLGYEAIILANLDSASFRLTDYLKLLTAVMVAIFLAVPHLRARYHESHPPKRRSRQHETVALSDEECVESTGELSQMGELIDNDMAQRQCDEEVDHA